MFQSDQNLQSDEPQKALHQHLADLSQHYGACFKFENQSCSSTSVAVTDGNADIGIDDDTENGFLVKPLAPRPQFSNKKIVFTSHAKLTSWCQPSFVSNDR